MSESPRAGQSAEQADLINVDELHSAYYGEHPNPGSPEELVEFGTSGHRGSALQRTFNEDHILSMSQAVCDYRREQGINGPLFLGFDTHALSRPAYENAIEVFVANGVDVRCDISDRFTPTPVISHAIIRHNAGRTGSTADGVVITPSHNPPSDGGFKYNPPHGGPAESACTQWLQERANELIRGRLTGVRRRRPYREIAAADGVGRVDYVGDYVRDLDQVVDMDAIRRGGVTIGVDPLGGSSLDCWTAIADHYGIDLTVVNPAIDPTFRFMTLDWDGKIRMDCSSPYAMSSLIQQRAGFDLALGNDADADRHGIVTRDAGLLNPNHYLTAAVDYLLRTRTDWPGDAAVGKTLVSSKMIEKVTAAAGRSVIEVPVGFKWFVPYLSDRTIVFGGEESAGASFLRRDGGTWTTDKDGIILGLLAAEMTAVTGETPSALYERLTERFGAPVYARLDASATREEKSVLSKLSPEDIRAEELAGEPILERNVAAKGNGAAIKGIQVVTENAWFTARPSGTEDVYKIYAESFRGDDHLEQVVTEAQEVVRTALQKS